jgi:hypothetical protein
MYLHTSPAKFAAILFAALLTFAAYTGSAAAFTCASGAESHTATAAEAASVPNGNIVAGLTQVCPEDLKLGISADVGAAKQQLSSMLCNSGVNVTQLDPKFSVCAVKFMTKLRRISPTSCIESAYRSASKQAAVCKSICGQLSCPGLCAAPGRSYHQKGLAIDIGKLNVPLQTFWKLASQSGLGNPSGLHKSDPNHIQVMNGGSNCSDIGYAPTTDDIFTAGPASSNPYFGYSASPMPSMQPVGTPTVTIPSTSSDTSQSTNQTQSQICTPSFSCTGNIMYYKTTSCTTQVYQTCPYGCGENSCNLSTSTSATVGTGVSGVFATSTNTNTNTNDNSSDATSSVSDILNSYLNPTAVEIGTSTSLAFRLNPETGDIEQIPVITNTGSLSPASGVISSIQPVAGQQTFTSNDLSGSGGYFSSQQQASSFQKVLEGMKSALLWAINALRSL